MRDEGRGMGDDVNMRKNHLCFAGGSDNIGTE